MAHSINPETCVGCGACKDTCPVEAISQDGEKCKVNPDACVDCGACEGVCPQHIAIREELQKAAELFGQKKA